MVLPDEACCLSVGGAVIAVRLLGSGDDGVQRDLVAAAVLRGGVAIAAAVAAELVSLVAERAAGGLEEAQAAAEAGVADA